MVTTEETCIYLAIKRVYPISEEKLPISSPNNLRYWNENSIIFLKSYLFVRQYKHVT
jgi:hypothetical protein